SSYAFFFFNDPSPTALYTLSLHDALPICPEALDRTFRQFRDSFDARHGGFGDAPKFPRPSELLFLMREYARTGNVDARDIALQTDRKSTRLNSSHLVISYAVFCLKKKKKK